MVAMLLEQDPTMVGCVSSDEQSALHVAAEEGNFPATKALAKAGVDLNLVDGDGNTAITIAKSGWKDTKEANGMESRMKAFEGIIKLGKQAGLIESADDINLSVSRSSASQEFAPLGTEEFVVQVNPAAGNEQPQELLEGGGSYETKQIVVTV